jgi:hypothetical protein
MSGLSHVPAGYDGNSYPFPNAQHDTGGNSITLQPGPNYNAVADDQDLAYHAGTAAQATHSYPVRPLSSSLNNGMAGPPPISPVPAADGWHSNGVSAPQDASTNGYRPWGPSQQYEAALGAQGHSSIPAASVPSAFDTSLSSTLPNQYQSMELQEGQPPWSQPISPPSHARVFTHSGPTRPAQEIPVNRPDAGPPPPNHNSSSEQSMYASASIAQQQMRGGPLSPSSSSSPAAKLPLPGHVYTRTLVGPLAANACRLLDEHRKPGVFFLFQDLSIRTEGTTRLTPFPPGLGVVTNSIRGLCIYRPFSPQATTHERWRVSLNLIRT